MLDEPVESIQRAFHLFRRDAVGEAEVAFAAKGVAGDEEEVFLLRFCAECVGIGLQAAREEIESSARLDSLIAHLEQGLVEQVFVALVDREICHRPNRLGGG